jgi:hypothetical protein
LLRALESEVEERLTLPGFRAVYEALAVQLERIP